MAKAKQTNDMDPVDAYLKLVADRGYEAVGMPEVAKASGRTLAQLRLDYGDPHDLLAKFSCRIDAEVLQAVPPELMEDEPRERLFDVLMMRIDALVPYKAALIQIADAMCRDPLALASWNRIAVRSQYWMMIAAGLDTKRCDTMVTAQALAVVFARTLRVWLRDEDAGMAQTMAELDRRLREAERLRRMAGGVAAGAERLLSMFSRKGRRRSDREPAYDAPNAEYGGPEAI